MRCEADLAAEVRAKEQLQWQHQLVTQDFQKLQQEKLAEQAARQKAIKGHLFQPLFEAEQEHDAALREVERLRPRAVLVRSSEMLRRGAQELQGGRGAGEARGPTLGHKGRGGSGPARNIKFRLNGWLLKSFLYLLRVGYEDRSPARSLRRWEPLTACCEASRR